MISIEIGEEEIKRVLSEYIEQKLGSMKVKTIRLLVKSKQNYRSEWENAGVLIATDDVISEKFPHLKAVISE